MRELRVLFKALLISYILGSGAISAFAQYAGTKYISVTGGTSIAHTSSKFSNPQILLGLSYGYHLNNSFSIDIPAIFQGIKHQLGLTGQSYSLQPTLYYSLYKRDKSRLDIGGGIGLGYETYNKPSDSYVKITGHLQSVCFYAGASLRYNLMISSRVAITGIYRFLIQPKSEEDMAQTLSVGLLLYI